MKLIAGLGNPGPRYAGSRHNVGFDVVDEIARRANTEITRFDRHYEALFGEAQLAGQRVLLLKPQTFMNLSGRSVAAVLRFYKLDPVDLLVIYDDLDLPVGRVRLRAVGSAGGHKGMLDVLRHTSTDEIARIRIGIGKVHPSATTEYVLSRFDPDERPVISAAISTAADAATCWARHGIETAMNRFNRKQEQASPPPKPDNDARSEGESN